MQLTIKQPTGISPRLDDTELPDNGATVAINCDLSDGVLKPLKGTASVPGSSVSGSYKTIYRMGQDVASDANYWLTWGTQVDVVRGQIYGDTTERTWFVQSGDLRYTNNQAGLGGAPYPTVSYKVPPSPDVAVTAAAPTGTGTGDDIPMVYLCTFLNADGDEGAPSPVLKSSGIPVATCSIKNGQSVVLTLPALPTGSYNFGANARKRIYRSAAGAALELRGEVLGSSSTFTDVVSNGGLGVTLSTPYNDPPPSGLAGMCLMSGGFVLAFKGIDVMPSKAYAFHAFPEDYRVSLHAPAVGWAAYDDTCVVATTSYPVKLVGTDPASLQPVPIAAFPQACVSKPSMISAFGGVMYASNDGLCYVGPDGYEVTTDALFRPEQWRSQFNPSSIHAYFYRGRYIGFYDLGDGTKGCFIFDKNNKVQPFSTCSIYATAGYFDPARGALFLNVGSSLVKWDAGSDLSMTWRSKKFVLPFAGSFSVGVARGNGIGSMALRFIGDGSDLRSVTPSSGDIFRMPPGRYSNFQVEVTGTGTLTQLDVASSVAELKQSV